MTIERNREEKADVLLAIARQYPFFARGYFKVDSKTVTLDQARELAARYPVFSIEANRSCGGRGRRAAFHSSRRCGDSTAISLSLTRPCWNRYPRGSGTSTPAARASSQEFEGPLLAQAAEHDELVAVSTVPAIAMRGRTDRSSGSRLPIRELRTALKRAGMRSSPEGEMPAVSSSSANG
jgi:hypothetical protein